MGISYEECEICCKKTWVFECGANNNCNKKVCDDCFYENPNSVDDCMFCFQIDVKRPLHTELKYFEKGTKASKILSRHHFLSFPQCMECEKEDDITEAYVAILKEIIKLRE